METFTSRYFRGRGRMFISDRIDATGLPVGFEFLGDLESASLQPDVQRGDVLENQSGSDAIGASWFSRVAFNVSFGMRSVSPAHFKHGTQGSETAYTANSITDQPHVAQQNRFIRLTRVGVSNVVVTDDPMTTTYTVDTDYVVHAADGLIEILSTGTIADDTALLFDFDFAAQSLVTSYPQNVAKYLMFSGLNTAGDSKRVRSEMYKVKLSPASIDMISDGAAAAPVTGVIEQDTLRAEGDQLFSWLIAA